MDAPPLLNSDIWVDQYGDALFGFAVARVKDRGAAEDLVQETFLAGLQAGKRFRGESSEKTWLFSILKHKIIDHYRKNKSTKLTKETLSDSHGAEKYFNSSGAWQIHPQHWYSHPGKNQQFKEFLDHFYRCLAELPQRNANAFVYREVDGLNTKEICKRLDVSENNCWVMLYRARMLLRRCLELAGFTPPHKKAPK
jgi:RNA polymerase sigma-70 factor (TIGR02943 family)